jgi:chromosome segregation ATPase
MKPAAPDPAELLHRVRQQLILAQVRIMELEDVRDELAPRLAEVEQLLTAAQSLADQKVDESAHLAKVQSDLQAQVAHLRHMQHVTHEALNDARTQLAGTADRLAAAEQRGGQLQKEIIALADQAGQLTGTISQLSLEVVEAHATAATRLARLKELEAEIRAMKASRSWRWTRWLRSMERGPGGR